MNDPTDDKIQQLVTAVLEAVDTRLEGIRHDMAQFAADIDERHHQVLATIAALEQRVDSLPVRPSTPTPPAAERSPKELGERMEQATKMLIDRIESAQRASMATTNQRLTQLDDRIEQLRALTNVRPDTEETASSTPNPVSSVPPAFVPSADEAAAAVEHHTDQLPHLANADLAGISRPLITHGHITTQVPIVLDHSGLRQMTAPPMPPLVTPHVGDGSAPTIATAPVEAQEEEIDIGRLTSLLNEKLGHLSLPPRPE